MKDEVKRISEMLLKGDVEMMCMGIRLANGHSEDIRKEIFNNVEDNPKFRLKNNKIVLSKRWINAYKQKGEYVPANLNPSCIPQE